MCSASCKAPGTGLSPEDMLEVRRNCPDLCDQCPADGVARATFHHNRFSCQVPETMGHTTQATAVMGNMLGNGQMLKVSWLHTEENFEFLYYSPRIWTQNVQVISAMMILFLSGICFWPLLRQQLRDAGRHLKSPNTSRVAASNLVVLKVATCTFFLCC